MESTCTYGQISPTYLRLNQFTSQHVHVGITRSQALLQAMIYA
jgi:hypothetical protein